MVRALGGILAGVAVLGVVVTVLQQFGSSMYPLSFIGQCPPWHRIAGTACFVQCLSQTSLKSVGVAMMRPSAWAVVKNSSSQ